MPDERSRWWNTFRTNTKSILIIIELHENEALPSKEVAYKYIFIYNIHKFIKLTYKQLILFNSQKKNEA